MNDQQVREGEIKSLQEAAAHLFGPSVEALRAGSTQRAVAEPRNIAIYLVMQLADASLHEIGRRSAPFNGDEFDSSALQ
jgi:chromosomal replication initiation ATPase DnaA